MTMLEVKSELTVAGARGNVRWRMVAETSAVVIVAEMESVVQWTRDRRAWLCKHARKMAALDFHRTLYINQTIQTNNQPTN